MPVVGKYKKKLKAIQVIMALACLVFISSCKNTTQPTNNNSLKKGMLKTINHERYYLNQQTGRVNVLVFWATWCSICKKELVAFEEYNQQMQNEKLNIAAVCFNPEELDKAKHIIEYLEINYTNLLDEEAKMYKSFQTNAAPITVLINSKGEVDQIVEGYNEQIMRKLTSRIEVLLENAER